MCGDMHAIDLLPCPTSRDAVASNCAGGMSTRLIHHMPSNGVNASLRDAIRWQGAGCKPAARRAMQKMPLKAAKGVFFHTQKHELYARALFLNIIKTIMGGWCIMLKPLCCNALRRFVECKLFLLYPSTVPVIPQYRSCYTPVPFLHYLQNFKTSFSSFHPAMIFSVLSSLMLFLMLNLNLRKSLCAPQSFCSLSRLTT